jgi:hypothetical protein
MSDKKCQKSQLQNSGGRNFATGSEGCDYRLRGASGGEETGRRGEDQLVGKCVKDSVSQ